MVNRKQLKALERAVRATGEKPLHKTVSKGTISALKRAAARTTVAQDKAALRAKVPRRP